MATQSWGGEVLHGVSLVGGVSEVGRVFFYCRSMCGLCLPLNTQVTEIVALWERRCRMFS